MQWLHYIPFVDGPDGELHMRKKQRQSERFNSLMNKYKLTAEKEKKQQLQQQQLGKNNSNKPIRVPQDKYTFTPEDFKYENKHYKYIKYTKYNKVSGIQVASH